MSNFRVNLPRTTAVILAGGLGTRLRPYLSRLPKVMAPVGGRPFITYLLDQLHDQGVTNVVICTGYMADEVRAHLGDRYRSISLNYSCEDTPMGTGGALRLALPKIQSDVALVMNGDSYFSADLSGFTTWFGEKDPCAGLMLYQAQDTARFGRVAVSGDGQVLSFKEKDGSSSPGLINAGLYLLKRETIGLIEENVFQSLENDLFHRLVGRGLFGYSADGRFIDIGLPETCRSAENFFKELRYGYQQNTL